MVPRQKVIFEQKVVTIRSPPTQATGMEYGVFRQVVPSFEDGTGSPRGSGTALLVDVVTANPFPPNHSL